MANLKPTHEQELEQILLATDIASPVAFTFADTQFSVTNQASQAASVSSPIIAQLQQCFYQHGYCSRFQPESLGHSPGLPVSQEDFLSQLSQANSGLSRWDMGWRVKRVEPTGKVWAEKTGVSRMFAPGEFVSFDAPAAPMAAGASIGAYVARESTLVQPGFYVAFGETISSSDPLDVVRFYWNIDGTGVRILLRTLTRDLNRFQVPFQFKCPIYWQSYVRRDTAVLYIKKNFFFLVKDLAASWHQECKLYLRDDVPLFSLRLFPGISLAEDPGNGESFGMNRCRHVAEAIWNSYTAGLPKEQYLQAVTQQFQRHGLDFSRPYLNAGSVDQYI